MPQVINTAAFTPAAGGFGSAERTPKLQIAHSGHEFGEPANQPGNKKSKRPWVVGGVLRAFIGTGAIGAATEKDEANSVPAATTTSAAPAEHDVQGDRHDTGA
ncbi:hypothetical protein [Prescottella equi]